MKTANHLLYKFGLSFGLALVLALASGCIEHKKVKVKPTTLPAVEAKVPASAALVITDDLKKYNTRLEQAMGSAIEFAMGPPIANYAEQCSKTLFKDVKVFDSQDSAVNQADVILVPKPVRSSIGVSTVDGIRIIVCVEWTVLDRSGQKPKWLTTVESDVLEKTGFNLGAHQKAAFQRLFDELGAKTVRSFSTSPEIKLLGTSPK